MFEKNNIEEIIKELTLEEKCRLVNGDSFFGMAEIERLKIPRMQLLDGGTGINFEQLFGDMCDVLHYQMESTNGMVGSIALINVIDNFFESEKLRSEEEIKLYNWIKDKLYKKLNGMEYAPGCFPPGMLLGATWNKDVVFEVGEALGKEANLYDVDVLLGSPNVNIHRDPLNGRLFEGYSEDPCLVKTLAPMLVKGVQKYGVCGNVKHFAANNQETNRVGINENISRRALEEIYFPGFKACVTEGKVKTVMSAYNKINNVPCTENYELLTEKLRNEWGFLGPVISDWGAVYNDENALCAGNDLAMPGPRDYKKIYNAVLEGRLSEEVLDIAVKRLLEIICWRNENYYQKDFSNKDKINKEFISELKEKTDKAAYNAAAEGIVLLKNDEILPLKENTKFSVLGLGAVKLLECGTGSAGITTDRTTIFSDCLEKNIGKDTCVLKSDGYVSKEILEKISKCDVNIYICKLSGMEGNDRKNMQLDIKDISNLLYMGALKVSDIPDYVIEELKEKNLYKLSDKKTDNIILVLNVCGPVDLSYINNDVVKATICTFLPGMEGGAALADIISGKINPSGKLPITFPLHYEDTPTCINFPGDGYEVNYGEDIYVGYRYYDKKHIKPLYPFGYGRSYTEFDFSNYRVNNIESKEIEVSINIKNIGKYSGAEVVQLYISDYKSTLRKPVKELKKFEKVYLAVGEEKTVEFRLDRNDFASFDMDLNEWTVEEGYYDIIIATSSGEDGFVAKERIYLSVKSPYSYGLTSTIKVLYEDKELLGCVKKLWLENKWDMGIIESNYQYTSHRILRDIIPAKTKEEKHKILMSESIKNFSSEVACVKRL